MSRPADPAPSSPMAAAVDRWGAFGAYGYVRQTQVVEDIRRGNPFAGLIPVLVMILVLLTALASIDEMVQCMMPFALLCIGFFIITSMAGLGGLGARMLGTAPHFLMGMFAARGRREPSMEPVIVFSLGSASAAPGSGFDVRLRGVNEGVHVGDEVAVRGIRIWGVMRAFRVDNVTRGRTLWRARLFGTIATAVVVVVLGLAVYQAGAQLASMSQ